MTQGLSSSGTNSNSNKSLKAAWKRALALADHSELRWIPAILGVILASVLHVEDNWLNLIIAASSAAMLCLLVATLVYWIKGAPVQAESSSAEREVFRQIESLLDEYSDDDEALKQELEEVLLRVVAESYQANHPEEEPDLDPDLMEQLCYAVNSLDLAEIDTNVKRRHPNAMRILHKHLKQLCGFEWVIAANPGTPDEILAEMVNSDLDFSENWYEWSVRQLVLTNTSDPNLLREASTSENERDLLVIASNANTPPEVLDRLATSSAFSDLYMWSIDDSVDDDDYEDYFLDGCVVQCVINNPTTSIETLEAIASGTTKYSFDPEFFESPAHVQKLLKQRAKKAISQRKG